MKPERQFARLWAWFARSDDLADRTGSRGPLHNEPEGNWFRGEIVLVNERANAEREPQVMEVRVQAESMTAARRALKLLGDRMNGPCEDDPETVHQFVGLGAVEPCEVEATDE